MQPSKSISKKSSFKMHSIVILLFCATTLVFGQIPKSATSCGLVTPVFIRSNMCPSNDATCDITDLKGYDSLQATFSFIAPVNSSTFSLASMHASVASVMEVSLLDEPIDQCFTLRNIRGRVGCPIIANEEYRYTFDPKQTALPQMAPHRDYTIECNLKTVFRGDSSDLEICIQNAIRF